MHSLPKAFRRFLLRVLFLVSNKVFGKIFAIRKFDLYEFWFFIQYIGMIVLFNLFSVYKTLLIKVKEWFSGRVCRRRS